MSTESVQTPFTVGLLMTFGDSGWVFSALECRLGMSISHGCARIVLSL